MSIHVHGRKRYTPLTPYPKGNQQAREQAISKAPIVAIEPVEDWGRSPTMDFMGDLEMDGYPEPGFVKFFRSVGTVLQGIIEERRNSTINQDPIK